MQFLRPDRELCFILPPFHCFPGIITARVSSPSTPCSRQKPIPHAILATFFFRRHNFVCFRVSPSATLLTPNERQMFHLWIITYFSLIKKSWCSSLLNLFVFSNRHLCSLCSVLSMQFFFSFCFKLRSRDSERATEK